MNRTDLIDRISRILKSIQAEGYGDSGEYFRDPVEAEELIDALERDGLRIERA